MFLIVRRRVCTALLLVAVLAESAAAQGSPDPTVARPNAPPEPHFVLGPVGISPAFSISEVGVDSNVFNSGTRRESDFTATLNPAVNVVTRMGLVRFSGQAALGLVFYNRFKAQQAVNGTYQGDAEMELSRIRPWVSVTYARTRTRPGFEIDLRARRTEPRVSVGSEVRLSGRTWFDFAYRHASFSFDEGQTFVEADLRTKLNRTAEAWSGTMRFAATPLTTLVAIGELERIRFGFSPLRDADSIRVMPGFEFNPDALVRGRAYAGFRRFKPLVPGVPAYAGVVAAVEVSSTVHATTKLDVRVSRDVSFSFEDATPYYVSTGAALVVTQRLAGPFDMRASGGVDRLRYRSIEGASAPLTALDSSSFERTDTVLAFGGGLGYHLGETARIGANVEYADRSSNAALANPYDRLRIYGSLNYEF
jgi:hypothetical protein